MDGATEDTTTQQPRWVIGRDSDVFRRAQGGLATQIGAWIDASYQDNDLDDESLSFNHVNAFLDTRYGSQWQLFFEAEYEREPNLSGFESESEFEIEQVYLKYASRDALRFRVGRFNTPFGYWTPVHWSILMDTIEKPIHDGEGIIPEQQLGVEVSGRFFPSKRVGRDIEIDYALYAGYGEESLDQEKTEDLSLGADLRVQLDEAYLLGLSFYQQDNRDFSRRTERNYLAYGDLQFATQWNFRWEYLHQERDSVPGARYDASADLFYAKLRWDVYKNVYLNYRLSHGDQDWRGRTIGQTVHTGTFGVHPIPAVPIKFEYSRHRFHSGPRAGFHFWGASVGYLF